MFFNLNKKLRNHLHFLKLFENNLIGYVLRFRINLLFFKNKIT